MNVYQSIDDIQYEKCFLCRPIPNKFYNYIHFYKISYNLLSFTLNTLLIWIEIKQYSIKEQADQFLLSYHMDPTFMEKMIQFEKNLLERFNQTLQKKIHYPSYDAKQILYHKNKLDPEQFRLFFRISGIWESETHIGLTSKVDVYPST
jgi:hypothetical protein